jgi:glutamine synthetase
MGVYKHNGLLKASIMSATNAHRLGGNEAPPAIISSFLGKQLTELLDHIELSDKDDLFTIKGKQGMEIDIPQIPDLIIDNTDRNRTSPFAFTGNRFEFRAPGSSANCASAMIALNSAVAEALQNFKQRVDKRIKKGESKLSAIVDVLREDIKTCKPIRFDGNGYSDEWVAEAAKRGLDVEKSCPKIFEHYLDAASVKMFESTKVMNRKELEARNEVKWETYVKTVQIEARVMGDMSMNHIIPVSTHYQSQLIKNVQGMKDVFSKDEAAKLSARNMKLIREIAERTQRIEQLVEELTEARRVANRIYNIHERAMSYHDTVCPKMDAIRYEIDHLEMIVEDGLWSLPKYRELLFIR